MTDKIKCDNCNKLLSKDRIYPIRCNTCALLRFKMVRKDERSKIIRKIKLQQEHYLNKLDKGIFHRDTDREKFVHYVEILDFIIEKLEKKE